MVVAEGVGDGVDAGVAGGGGVVEAGREGDVYDAVGGSGDLDHLEAVGVGVVVVAQHNHLHLGARIRAGHVVSGDGCFVGVVGGEDADGDVALGDVAVGVGDEVVDLVVGVDLGGVVAGGVGEPGGQGAGEGSVVGGFGHCDHGEGLVLWVRVVGQQSGGGEADRGSLVDVEVIGVRVR